MAERIIASHAGYDSKDRFINGFLARPAVHERRPGVVLLSAMWGLNWTQKEITRSFARAGFVALSPDLLDGQLPKDRASALLAKTSLDIDRSVDEIVAAARYLRRLPCVGTEGRLGVVGFCLGGGLALLALAHGSIDRARACALVRSPYLPEAASMWMRRASLERRWIERGVRELDWRTLVDDLADVDGALASRWRRAGIALRRSPRAAPRAWVDRWRAWRGKVPANRCGHCGRRRCRPGARRWCRPAHRC